MPRIEYMPCGNAAGPAEVVEPILARRGGSLLNIDRMLLHSLPLTAAWGTFLGAIRGKLAVPSLLTELAICAVSARLNTHYELHHHRDLFINAGGSSEQFDALGDLEAATQQSPLFDASQRALLRLALEMTRDGQASDATFSAFYATQPDETQRVELVAVIATYNMVGRFINTLDVQAEHTN